MSKAEFLITVFTFIGAIVTGISAIEQHIIQMFLKKSAISSQNTTELKKFKLISRWRLHRLKQLGAIIEVNSEEYYYNESRYKTLLRNRVIAVITIIIIVLILTMIF